MPDYSPNFGDYPVLDFQQEGKRHGYQKAYSSVDFGPV
jgi:hypothetical protein